MSEKDYYKGHLDVGDHSLEVKENCGERFREGFDGELKWLDVDLGLDLG